MIRLTEKVYIKKGSNWDLVCVRDSFNAQGEEIKVEDKYYFATIEQAISRAVDCVLPEEAESIEELLLNIKDCKTEILKELNLR